MNTKQKPMSIQSDEIAIVAQQGVERALAARKRMMELSSEEVSDVSGGIYNPIIAGMWSPINSGIYTPMVASLDFHSSINISSRIF